jgi:heme-degrading monooxygenase HmoA
MIAVIFEVWPAEGAMQQYLDLAAALRDDLADNEGFISVERFQSLTDPTKLLSLSFFRDEAAVRAWRERPRHRATQSKGRAGVFLDYRLRIASVVRDYGLNDRADAPVDSRAVHDIAPFNPVDTSCRQPQAVDNLSPIGDI